MVEQHQETGAGVTVAAIRQPITLADQFGVIEVDDADQRKIGQFLEKPKNAKGLPDAPDEVLASMGNYVFDADVLVDAVTSDHDLEGTKHDMISLGDEGLTPRQRSSQLTAGLGLLEDVIVDQHFDQRGRYGRLMSLVANSPNLLGIGIDENTAVEIRDDRVMPRNGIPVTLRASRATITVAPAKTTALPDVPLARPIDSCRSTPARSWRR